MMPHPLPATILRGNSIVSRIMIAIDDSEHSARETSWRILPTRCWEDNLWKDDRLFWIAESSEYLFQGVHHRWWPAEEEDGLWTGRRKTPAKNISGDSPGSLWPSRRRLF
jgi:hypothetical protein